jgi:hypothetical protein
MLCMYVTLVVSLQVACTACNLQRCQDTSIMSHEMTPLRCTASPNFVATRRLSLLSRSHTSISWYNPDFYNSTIAHDLGWPEGHHSKLPYDNVSRAVGPPHPQMQ